MRAETNCIDISGSVMSDSGTETTPMTYRGSGGGHEDEGAKVGSALVAQGASGVDQSTDAVRLDGGTGERAGPGGGGASGLLGLEELLFGVGGLSLSVGVTEDRAEDCEGDGVVEEGAEGDSRWLDGREVWKRGGCVSCLILTARLMLCDGAT